jgi:hypothetical protein
MESRQPGPSTLQHHDAVLGTLRGAGFSVAMTAHAYALLDSCVYGFALQEASLPFKGADSGPSLAEPMRQFPVGAYPHLVEMGTEHVLRPGYDFGNEFEFGLDVILDASPARFPPRQVSEGWRKRLCGLRTPCSDSDFSVRRSDSSRCLRPDRYSQRGSGHLRGCRVDSHAKPVFVCGSTCGTVGASVSKALKPGIATEPARVRHRAFVPG